MVDRIKEESTARVAEIQKYLELKYEGIREKELAQSKEQQRQVMKY